MSIAASLASARTPSTASGALLNANSTTNPGSGTIRRKNKGRLRLTVLSAYDLPDREPPSYIQLDIVDQTNDTNTSRTTTNETTATGATENNSSNNNNNNNNDTMRSKKRFRTGPPVQRHKDRNSFKFHSHHRLATSGASVATASRGGELIVDMPTLAELYESTAVLTVVYSDPSKRQYSSSYPLKQLLIHETTWLILNLSPVAITADSTPATGRGDNNASPSPEEQQQQQLARNAIDNNGGDDDSDDEIPPTLRLQMKLEGPYRTEIAALVHLIQAWLSLVADVQSKLGQVLGPYVPHNLIKGVPIQWLLVPATPLLAMAVVSTPILLGVVLVTLPFSLPLLVALGIMGTTLLACGTVVYASTREGRVHVTALLSPIHHALIQTHTGQEWVYQTGPRPTPVQLLRSTIIPTDIWGKLLFSLWIDFVGSASYLLPLVGEGLDVFWAPIQTTLIMALYCPPASGRTAFPFFLLPYLSFIEEILPFTDIVPTATMGWLGEFAWPMLMGQVFSSSSCFSSSNTAPASSSICTTNNPHPPVVVPNESLRDSLTHNQGQ
ncbi:hypothetical protein ACA910_015977 [Epithemia clementina (nom. ined.)]